MTLQIDLRAAAMLLVTLLLGAALGALGTAAVARHRDEVVRDLRRPDGFVAHMERVVTPHDSAQRARVLPLLERTAARNDSILASTNAQLRGALDTMMQQLQPLLDDQQRQRLADAARLAPEVRPGGGRGAPRGPGSDGRRPPDDRGPPPPDDQRPPPPDRRPPPHP